MTKQGVFMEKTKKASEIFQDANISITLTNDNVEDLTEWIAKQIDYHSRPELSQSNLKFLLESEKAFIENLNNPKPPTKEMEFGTMVHKYLLEFDTFDSEYCIIPTKPDNAKGNAKRDSAEYLAYQNWIESIPALNDRIEVTESDIEMLKAMKLNFEQQLANEKLTLGKSEVKIFWSEYSGLDKIDCRGMIDNLAFNKNNELVAIDIKTTASLNAKELYYTCKRFRYDIQQAFYERGLKEMAIDVKGFKFFFIEKKAPYDCRIVTLGFDTINEAQLTIDDLLETYTNLDKNNPKGYEPLELNL